MKTEQVCPVCKTVGSTIFAKSHDVEYQTLSEEFFFLECVCGTVYIDHPPKDKIDVIYPKNYYSYVRNDGIVTKVKRLLDKRTFKKWIHLCQTEYLSLLDIGGGNGIEAQTARAADLRIRRTVVVDLDESARESAESRGNVFVNSSIENFESKEKFDLVLALNLIEHVADPRSVLIKAYSLMNFGGLILLKTPNIDSLDCRIFKNHNWGGFHTPRHWVLFNEKTISTLLEETGFRVVSVRYTQGGPFWTIGLQAFLREKISFKRNSAKVITETRFFNTLMPILACIDLIRSKAGFKTSQMFLIATKLR